MTSIFHWTAYDLGTRVTDPLTLWNNVAASSPKSGTTTASSMRRGHGGVKNCLYLTFLLFWWLNNSFLFRERNHLFQRNQNFQVIEFVDQPIQEKLDISRSFLCIAFVMMRFLSPDSTVSARNAWDQDFPFGAHTREKKKKKEMLVFLESRSLSKWLMTKCTCAPSYPNCWSLWPCDINGTGPATHSGYFYKKIKKKNGWWNDLHWHLD